MQNVLFDCNVRENDPDGESGLGRGEDMEAVGQNPLNEVGGVGKVANFWKIVIQQARQDHKGKEH